MSSPIDKAVILARGLGTRMRKQDQAAALSEDQAAMAQTGVKAMIPIDRPFLDYVLSQLADAGYRRVCLVIGPEHQAVRDYYTKQLAPAPQRLTIDFAIQEKPLGTADAVRAAETFAGDDGFLLLNSDNYYPPAALRGLREAAGPAVAVFDRRSMVEVGNIDADRISKFAVVLADESGGFARILEKPTPEQLADVGDDAGVSMNCWRFGPAIFEACANITASPRGELELPDAVQYAATDLGERFEVQFYREAVLDLSSRGDIASVAQRLKGVKVSL